MCRCVCLNDCQTGSSSHHPCRRAFVGWVSSAWPWSSPLGGGRLCCCCPQGGSCFPGRTGWPGGAIWRCRTVLHLGREGGTGEELVTHVHNCTHTHKHTSMHTDTTVHKHTHEYAHTRSSCILAFYSFQCYVFDGQRADRPGHTKDISGPNLEETHTHTYTDTHAHTHTR